MLRCGPFPLYSSSRYLCHQTCHLAESPHKSFVVRCQSEEASHVMHTLWLGPLNNRLDLLRGSLDSPWADFKTKIINLVFQELALMKSPVQLCFPELVQCSSKFRLNINISSRYPAMNLSKLPTNTLFISCWNVAGAFVSPNSMTKTRSGLG